MKVVLSATFPALPMVTKFMVKLFAPLPKVSAWAAASGRNRMERMRNFFHHQNSSPRAGWLGIYRECLMTEFQDGNDRMDMNLR